MDINPCVCGRIPEVRTKKGYFHRAAVYCECGMRGPIRKGEESASRAIEAWNERMEPKDE
jgi:hypothetical protein